MRISEQWLREWVNPALTTDELVARLTMAGLEVDSVEPVAGLFSGVVVARIQHVEAHPNAEKLRICQVDVGEETPLAIVCGAPNAREGLVVPCARIGAKLPGITIKKAKLRGVESQGMLAAASELGLVDNSEGLWELPDDAPIGADLREWLGLDDHAIDVDLTPNRSDCLGIAGLAREVGVVTRTDVTPLSFHEVGAAIGDTPTIDIQAPEQCPRYVGRIIRGIDITAPTPLWMIERLRRSGIRSIDAVVDVTNYVMLELGQPMHAFDLAQIAGGIRVRLAQPEETLTLLDGQTLSLQSDTLVIADHERALAMAGVMGGEDSGVSANTQDILLESAYFDAIAIAGKARRHGLHTDSSHRFERGVDFALQHWAIERATELLLAIVGGKPGPVVEATALDQLPELHPILLRRQQIERVLGFSLPQPEVEDILGRLGMDVVEHAEGWHVVPPSYRYDIRIEVDLIEELGRVWGYDRIPVRVPAMPFCPGQQPEQRLTMSRFKLALVDRDYQEAITYSFVEPALLARLEPDQVPQSLANPISADMAQMRTTLWAGLIKAAQHNIKRQQARVRLFETGLVFRSESDQLAQLPRIAGLAVGGAQAESWGGKSAPVDFFDVKGDLEALLALGGAAESYQFVAATHPALHPGQSAQVVRADQPVGWLGALHPELQRALDFAQPVYLFELDSDAIAAARLPAFQELSRFPEVRRDLAIIIEEKISAQSILNLVRTAAGRLLTNVVIFDVYQGANVAPGYKSVAFGLTLRDATRTLKDEEVNAVVEQVVTALKTTFNVTLRE